MKTITKALAALLVLASFVMLTGCNKPRSEKKILSFKIFEPAVEATIMESAKTVIATVPEGTNVTALVPIITVSDKAMVNPASGVPQNFTTSKTYTVTAEDGTQAVYTVTVIIGNGGGGNGGDDNGGGEGDDNGGEDGDDNGDDNGDGNGSEEPQTYTISVSASPIAGGIVSGGGTYEEGQSCTVTVTANDGFVFYSWSESNERVSSDVTYSFTVDRDRSLVAHFAMSDGDGHAYVDLGLPSGTLWAFCNIGATSPEDDGDYFAWGETETKPIYNWSTYQFCNGSYNTITKYCNDSNNGNNGFTDNITILLPEDDVANVQWGDDWHIPTRDEWNELLENTTDTWTTQNRVYGRLITATNGASIFLPAAGYHSGNEFRDAGSHGHYWASSILSGASYLAWYLKFYSSSCQMNYYGYRMDGQSVRPVRSASQN